MHATIDMTNSIQISKSPAISDSSRYKSASPIRDDVSKKDIKVNLKRITKSKERLKSMVSYTIELIKPHIKNIEKDNKDKDLTDIRFYTLQSSKNNKVNNNDHRNTPNEMAKKDIQVNKKQIDQPKSSNSFNKIEYTSLIQNTPSITAINNPNDRRKSLNTINEVQNISMSMIIL